jgi:hypothetical protein
VHGGGLALLLGALGLAGLRTGAVPRPLAIAALAAAGVNALAPPVLAFPRAALVMPAGRFPSFLIIGTRSGAVLTEGHKIGPYAVETIKGHLRVKSRRAEAAQPSR